MAIETNQSLLDLMKLATWQEYYSNQSQTDQEAFVYEYNASIADREADLILENAATEAKAYNDLVKQSISSQRAAFAASGVVTTEGSPLDTQITEAINGSLSVQNIVRTGNIQAEGQRSNANLQRYYANIARAGGQVRGTNIIMTGIGNILSSFPDTYSSLPKTITANNAIKTLSGLKQTSGI